MSGNTYDIQAIKTNDNTIISYIASSYEQWKMGKAPWEERMLRTRDYLYATRTDTTENSAIPQSNSTTIPKLAQLKNTLHAQYLNSLFGIDPWFKWEAEDEDSATKDKVKIINAYVGTKLKQDNAMKTLSLIIRDWIQTGNCFAKLIWVDEAIRDPKTGKRLAGYVGPRIIRQSYLDVTFNLTADSYYQAPKIIHCLKSLGELNQMALEQPESGVTPEMVNNLDKKKLKDYGAYTGMGLPEVQKGIGMNKDGFSNYIFYENYQYAEILEFTGDIYYDGKLHKNRIITILNRQYILRNIESPSWSGSDYQYHAAWDTRPDNLMGFGPLDNLVGMQFLIDKLENTRADFFDAYANPSIVKKGNVEQVGLLGELDNEFICDENADVRYLTTDPMALQADTQIGTKLQMMDNMALVPPQMQGFKAPGEQTKFEAGMLQDAAMLAFNNKVKEFEETFLEPLLNDFLEMARRCLSGSDVVALTDSSYNATEFLTITKDDLMAVGKLVPMGSRYAANQMQVIQALNSIFNSGATQYIAPHISRIKTAKLLQDMSNLSHYNIVQEDVGIIEDAQTQSVAQEAQRALTSQQAAAMDNPSRAPAVASVPDQQPLIPGNSNNTSGDFFE
jgi:hypothetical protein